MADPHHTPDDYVRGSQEISEQASTFEAFMGMAKWGSLAISACLLFLTLWFQPGGSFITGLISAGVLAVGGYFFLKSGKKPAGH